MVDIKKLKPIGVVMILAFSVLALIVCFTADMGVPDRITPEHDTEYYRRSPEHLAELQTELSEKLFPQIEGEISCRVDEESMTLIITASKRTSAQVKSAAERDFDPSLFSYVIE